MRILHIGGYGIPKLAIPGALPPLDAPAPETQWRDTLCSWMKRIRAAGFDDVAPETRTPAHTDDWLGVVGQAARDAGLRFGTGWQLHDEASVAEPDWCASPNWCKDTTHPHIRKTSMSLSRCPLKAEFYISLGPVARLLETFGGPLILNMESFFGACADFPQGWGNIIGEKLGKWLVSMAKDGHTIYWYHPDGDQASSSPFEKAAYAACYAETKHANIRYCRTASSNQRNDAFFRNHTLASGKSWDLTTALWRSLPATATNPAVLSVAFDKIDAVLRDMGV